MRKRQHLIFLWAAAIIWPGFNAVAAETTQTTFTLVEMAARYKELGKAAISTPTPVPRAAPARPGMTGEINISFDHFVKKDPRKALQKVKEVAPTKTPHTGELTLKDFGLDLPGPLDGQKDDQESTGKTR